MLVLSTRGDAGAIVQGSGGDAFTAWWRLGRRFAPRTPALRIAALMAVVRPKPVRELDNVLREVERWEAAERSLRLEHEEELSDGIMIAILLQIVPQVVRDQVYEAAARSTEYRPVRDAIRAAVENRRMLGRPAPMDVDRVEEDGDEEGSDVDGVDLATAVCRCCGGKGHFARVCPSARAPPGIGS